jgi:hypothetical protein
MKKIVQYIEQIEHLIGWSDLGDGDQRLLILPKSIELYEAMAPLFVYLALRFTWQWRFESISWKNLQPYIKEYGTNCLEVKKKLDVVILFYLYN